MSSKGEGIKRPSNGLTQMRKGQGEEEGKSNLFAWRVR